MNPEFRLWLSGRGKAFGDLSEEEAKKQFKKFVDKWNEGMHMQLYNSHLPLAFPGLCKHITGSIFCYSRTSIHAYGL